MELMLVDKTELEEILTRLLKEITPSEQTRWVDEETAKSLLNIKSKSYLWKLRTENKIQYSQIAHKVILYDRISIMQFIESKIQTF